MERLLNDIREEVKKATAKFPVWPTDPIHAKAILEEEVGELAKAVLQTVYEPDKAGSGKCEVEAEAIQVAAMAIRFLLSLDKYQYSHCVQHKQS